MPETDSYKTVRQVSYGQYKEKGSRFVAAIWPVSEEKEIRSVLEETRREHHEARHHCYAYLIGPDKGAWRANDDGEPSGTAGRPILGQIRSSGLINVLIVVSRYFGGTLLGVSGLANAYKSAAHSAIANAEIVKRYVCESCDIVFPYAAMQDVMKIIKDENVEQSGHSFELTCKMTIQFRRSARERILARLSRIEGCEYKMYSEGKGSDTDLKVVN